MSLIETTTTPATASVAIFAFKTAWKGIGAVVLSSSDGTTYNASGDQISHGGSGAGGMANNNAWFRITDPDGVYEFLFQRQTNNQSWTWALSRSSKFVTGAPNATTRPSAADEIVPVNQQVFEADGSYGLTVGVVDIAPWPFYFYASFFGSDSVGLVHRPIPAGGTGTNPSMLVTGQGYNDFAILGATGDVDLMQNVCALAVEDVLGGGGPDPDDVPPIITAFTPVTTSSITRTATIAVGVTDDVALGSVLIWGVLADGTAKLVYDGSAFVGSFLAGSTLVGSTYTVAHASPGWPSSTLALHVKATDTGGNITSSIGSFTISNPPTSPVFGSFSPAAGEVGRTAAIGFTVSDTDGFSKVVVWAVLADGTSVMVYNGATFGSEVNAASTADGTTTKTFSIKFDGAGWVDDYTLHALAIDANGASTSASSAYTLSDPPEPEVPDATPPVISAIIPASASDITTHQAVRVTVTDAVALRRVRVFVTMGIDVEVAHTGYAFTPRYEQGSTRTVVDNGYAFVLLRSGGWTSDPTFEVQATDVAGNEV